MLRRCKGRYTEFDRKTRKYAEKEFHEGTFHQWGNDFEEFEDGPGNYTVAIVELPDGKVVTPNAKDIQFIDKEEKGE